jgi:pSer/pThr/pTyr-binding forkhead associated (FHA) protein
VYRLRAKYHSQIEDFRVGALAVTIGRDPSCDIRLDHPAVSKKHARLVVEQESLMITDLDSTAGTFVNTERIDRETEVDPGDKIRIGDHVFLVIAENDLGIPVDTTSSMRTDALRPSGPARRFPGDMGPGLPGAVEQTVMMDSARLEAIGDKLAEAPTRGPAIMVRGSHRYPLPVAIAQVEMTVGRSAECGLILDDPSVSSLHCRFVKRKDRVYVYDENSLNGTYVSAEKVRGLALRHGDLVLVGGTVLEFSDPTSPPTEADRETVENEMVRIIRKQAKESMPPGEFKGWFIWTAIGVGLTLAVLALSLID